MVSGVATGRAGGTWLSGNAAMLAARAASTASSASLELSPSSAAALAPSVGSWIVGLVKLAGR
eukprot:4475850-Heterocapsa_arctica.AAC.1